MPEKVSIVLFSGSFDKLIGTSILVGGAVGMDFEVDIFLQMWGVHAFTKEQASNGGLPLSKEFEQYGPIISQRLKELKMPTWLEMLMQAKSNGNVKIHACSAAMQVWGLKKEDLIDLVDDVMGAGEFIERSKDAKETYFV